MEYQHTPVMLSEVIAYLDPKPGENFIDGTLGGGGYTAALAGRVGPKGKVLAIDLDELAIKNAEKKFAADKNKNLIIAHDNFKNLSAIVKKYFPPDSLFNGIVFDLGLSSAQLQDRTRGFSFNLAGSPLSMNFGQSAGPGAAEILNHWSEKDLSEIFKNYGEEKFAFKIAAAIVRERRAEKINTTDRLVKIILEAVPKRFRTGKIHPATRIFQALRLAVNDELNNLSQALPQAVSLLKPGGRIAVISYHSLEDRIVKQYFRQEAKGCLCPPEAPVCHCGHRASLKLISRGVLRPSEEEVAVNPRSRSAKLRVAEKL